MTGSKLYIALQQISLAEMRQKRNTKNGVTFPVFNVGLWPPYFRPHDRRTVNHCGSQQTRRQQNLVLYTEVYNIV